MEESFRSRTGSVGFQKGISTVISQDNASKSRLSWRVGRVRRLISDTKPRVPSMSQTRLLAIADSIFFDLFRIFFSPVHTPTTRRRPMCYTTRVVTKFRKLFSFTDPDTSRLTLKQTVGSLKNLGLTNRRIFKLFTGIDSRM